MKRSINFYKDLQKLNDYIYHTKQYKKPEGWICIDKYNDKKTGMYAEAYQHYNGEVVMVIKGMNIPDLKDIVSAERLEANRIPSQVEPAYKFYSQLSDKYENVVISGYSLGGSIAQILGNDLGVETITFEAYGTGDFIKPNHTENIINFGNENDPVFLKKINKQIGTTYIIPKETVDNDKVYYSENKYSVSNINNINLGKHFPGNYGDISKAVLYSPPPFKLHASYDKYNDDIFSPYNRIFHKLEMNVRDMDEETLKQYVNQYYDDDYKFSQKEELDRRVRFGELIYVEDYVRSDGTKVSGYYRRYPNK